VPTEAERSAIAQISEKGSAAQLVPFRLCGRKTLKASICLGPLLHNRFLTFVVSTFGSLGAQAQDLIKEIGRRTNLFVPFSLTHETSWATSSITTFLRSALTFHVPSS